MATYQKLLVFLFASFATFSWAEGTPSIADLVQNIHGDAGPWVVVGYRIGEYALTELNREKYDFTLEVVHRSPAAVQYSCVVDGVQAATGASLGKMNLRWEEVSTPAELETIVGVRSRNDASSPWVLTSCLVFKIKKAFQKEILNVPYSQFDQARLLVLNSPAADIFDVQSETPCQSAK